MKIIPARPEDSHLIGESVVEAIGIEIAQNLAGENHTLEDVVNMFAMLAKRDDTQYSYTNTLVALDDRGNPVGVCVGYDGARLHELRFPFFEAVSSCLGLSLEGVEDECDAEEFYLDTLAVLTEYRGKGIAVLPSVANRQGYLLIRLTLKRADCMNEWASLRLETAHLFMS